MDWYFVGVLCTLIVLIWIGDLFFDVPKEDFDKDLSREEQESNAREVVDSMRGQLEGMRKDGLL